ncbi:MAG: EscU/YscU/HrcU family type III secretion system export apparatus switch protein [Succinivibrionaceae bacterium]
MNNNDLPKAISLRYDQTKDKVPIVAQKGEGKVADDIINMAKELGLYVHKDPTLLHHLDKLQEGEGIPKPLFLVISEIIAYSYYLQGKTPESYRDSQGRHIRTKA